MNQKKQVGRVIVALMLFVAIMLPTSVQLFHAFEGHEHIACTKKASHIHEFSSKCDICDFHLASFDYQFINLPDLGSPEISTKQVTNFDSFHFYTLRFTNTQLRAPPANS